ncbi:DUF421 domain-containing protein [Sediminibacillus massiliensis]|uniref:DUF421 domain-containing protein n=1 Tax=Sediminibacillus massiliensis TaxID=1926277 RepID=UPI0009885499|nr:DUF421 domain-containing protein [Sediminibacillus massiliensis]
MNLPELLGRIAIGFIVLFVLTRIMGRKEISQMTFFNFVSAIAVGSITANLVVNQNLSIRNGVIALVGWTAFTLLMGFMDMKSKKARKVLTGDPIMVIKEGKIVESALAKCRLDLDSLKAMLRRNNVFSLNEVDYATFETNGKLSVMKKDEKQGLTKKDMNILSSSNKYPVGTEVISDGKVVSQNLTKLNLDQQWLDQQLQQAGIDDVSKVFYAEVEPDGSLFIDDKENQLH